MQDKKTYPFKRNRFYPGKLLSSYDFLVEQRYFGDKRRFINRAVFGPGVVSGMSAYKIDDFSLMIKSGFALDFDGREIVLEKDDIKRLSTIEGFSKTTGDKLSLYIRYSEEQITPVFAVDKQEQGEKLEHNHIAEGCMLFVADSSGPAARESGPDFVIKRTLVQDRHYLITLETPGYACRGFELRPSITVTKLSSEDAELSFSARLQSPAFESAGGEDEKNSVQLTIKAGQLKPGKSLSRHARLTPTGNVSETTLFVEAGQAVAVSGGSVLKMREDVRVPIRIGDLPPRALIRGAVAQMPLEALFDSGAVGIRLAEITVARSGDSCMIDTVEETAEHVGATPLQQRYLNEYSKFYSQSPALPSLKPQAEKKTELALSPAPREQNITTGATEIPLGMKARAGEVYYSDHIIHQLGPGNVFVSAGFESIKQSESREASQLTVYGDTSLFKDSGISVQTAVRVDAARGTFQIAARLLEQVSSIFLTIRWVAVRLPDAERYALTASAAKKRLFARPATKALYPKEKWAISVEFEGMEPATCRFEVMDAAGGSITSDGVYTAPGSEGVYDIKISVVDEPNLAAYAYAVVRRKED